ncbi:MAG: AAA family ATPase [Planctomycetota bacterium]|nr:AAA family ATPase [Planctomycetota bacterium]
MLRSLTIQGFRGIDSLELSDLGFVNVFVGSNGAGKTTILEAASIVGNPLSPGLLAMLNGWREMPPFDANSQDGLQSFFHDMSSEPIRLKWDGSDGGGELIIRPRWGIGIITTTTSTDSLSPAGASSSASERLQGIDFEYLPNGGSPITQTMTLIPNGFHVQEGGTAISRPLGGFYIHARRATSMGDTATLLTMATERRTEDRVIQAMRRVDPRVVRLVPGYRQKAPIILADIGLRQLIPANVLGDGFCRVLLMVTGALLDSGRLLLVDEIDSGLHHSVMKGFWKSLLELRKFRDFQVLCTTHSEDMLRSTLDAFEDSPDSLRVFRIDRSESNHLSLQKYGFDMLRDATVAGMDVR